jgi:hypothetical protein
MTDTRIARRRFVGAFSAGVACLGAPALSSAALIPFPVRPKIQRKADTLVIGYFGDSTTRGAWYNGNPEPYPNPYSYISLTPMIEAALSDLGPVTVHQKGEDAQPGYVLLHGGYIPAPRVTVDPFETRLTEHAYDAAIVGVGICDALYGQSVPQFRATLAGLWAAAKKADVSLFFETPTPIPRSPYSPILESYRSSYAVYDIIDQNFETDMSDEFHPIPATYELKVRRIADTLRNALIRRFTLNYV